MPQVGLATFHEDVFLTLCYSNFLIEVQCNYQSGTTQLQSAKKMEPTMSDNFAIFVREQVGQRKCGTSYNGCWTCMTMATRGLSLGNCANTEKGSFLSSCPL